MRLGHLAPGIELGLWVSGARNEKKNLFSMKKLSRNEKTQTIVF